MRYYKTINDNNEIQLIGTGEGGIEIPKEEYDALLNEFQQKGNYVRQVFTSEIAINEVPMAWRAEIEKIINLMMEAQI